MHNLWSVDEEAYLKSNAGLLTDQTIADNLTRMAGRFVSLDAVRKKRQKMGLKKRKGRGLCELDYFGSVWFSDPVKEAGRKTKNK